MIGDITKDSRVSMYQPPDDIKEMTINAKRDFSVGTDILNNSYSELNNYSVIDRMNKDQRTFQSFVDESVENPDEAWKWVGTRSLARKKAFAMHSHLTSAYIIPNVIPQNSSQNEDKEAASIMKDLVEWETINSNYRPAFLLVSMGMLVNPVTYLHIDYIKVQQTIKEKLEEGYQETEILDEVLSGVNCKVLSADQILITNAYEQEIQKQRSITKTRYVEYTDLKARYENHPNWGYLQPGVKTIYNEVDGLFYDIVDDDHPYLVEETTWEVRRDDSEICFLNGIYFGNDNVEWNPIRHRDNRNAPKYDFVPFGYHRVNEHFFYFTSLMNEVGWDDRLIDAMYQVTMNREFIDLEQPVFVTGVDKVDTSIVFPGAAIATMNKDARITPIVPPRSGNPYQALQTIEDSMSEASLSETQMGALPSTGQTAYTVAKTEQNAKILLSGVLKNLGWSVAQVGDLLIDIALQHLTVAQVDEISGDLNYREFILNNQMVNGKQVSKKIRFDETLIENKMSPESRKSYSLNLLKESGYPDNKQVIYAVNPYAFSRLKYLTQVEPDEMTAKNSEFERLIWERLYSLLRMDPLVEPEALVRELLYASRPKSVDELLKKNQGQDQMTQMIQNVIGQTKNSNLPGFPASATAGIPA